MRRIKCIKCVHSYNQRYHGREGSHWMLLCDKIQRENQCSHVWKEKKCRHYVPVEFAKFFNRMTE